MDWGGASVSDLSGFLTFLPFLTLRGCEGKGEGWIGESV